MKKITAIKPGDDLLHTRCMHVRGGGGGGVMSELAFFFFFFFH